MSLIAGIVEFVIGDGVSNRQESTIHGEIFLLTIVVAGEAHLVH